MENNTHNHRLQELFQRLQYNFDVTNLKNRHGIVENYIEVNLMIKELPFAAWWDIERNDAVRAIQNTNPFVTINNRKYLKTYSTLVDNPKDDLERTNGRRYFHINKDLYPDGLCYNVKRVRPRPTFERTMYRVYFTSLERVKNQFMQEIRNLDENIQSTMIDFSFHLNSETFVVQLRLNDVNATLANSKQK